MFYILVYNVLPLLLDGSTTEVTAGLLKTAIEQWLKTRYDLSVTFSTAEPIKQLEDLGLLKRVLAGKSILCRRK